MRRLSILVLLALLGGCGDSNYREQMQANANRSLEIAVGLAPPSADELDALDVVRDGQIDIKDALQWQRYADGLE